MMKVFTSLPRHGGSRRCPSRSALKFGYFYIYGIIADLIPDSQDEQEEAGEGEEEEEEEEEEGERREEEEEGEDWPKSLAGLH